MSIALQTAIDAACARHGEINICVAGAAGTFVSEAAAMSANGFRSVVEIDLLGIYNTSRAAYPKLRRPGANLLAISAVQSVTPTTAQAHLCSAKAGVNMLLRCLSIEWGPEGIRCNGISPGPVAETEGMARLGPKDAAQMERLIAGIPLGRYATRDEVADLALFLVSGAAPYIHGTVVAIDGGQTNLGSQAFGEVLADMLKSSRATS